jgi:hypothetical protein
MGDDVLITSPDHPNGLRKPKPINQLINGIWSMAARAN